MAKQYFAVNLIRYGQPGGEVTEFAPGKQVTGLPKETMVELWESGVLTEVDPESRVTDDRDAKIAELETELAALKAAAAAEEEAVGPGPAEEMPDESATEEVAPAEEEAPAAEEAPVVEPEAPAEPVL